MKIKVDVTEIDDYAKKLSRLHRKHLPSAVRATLSGAAFEVKKNTLIKSTQRKFTNREKNFFKANSKVIPATGFNIDTMQSVVGMVENKLKGGNNFAVKDLEKQEAGGIISNKAFIPMRTARVSKSDRKKVRSANRLSDLKGRRITPVNKSSGKTKKQQFIRAAMYSIQHGDGYVLGHRTAGGGRTLWKINSISQNARNRSLKINAVPLYNVLKGRTVRVKPTNYMAVAAEMATKKIPAIWEKEAKFQINKAMKL